ncbi:hypothetical protein Fcan01_26480 [Folsomia candida]|uniref:Uncharacterized protein n=2 Tax=Folsomia candida TaxID=158441 RepID=A0A226CZK2_FOLCA|nr:hypothetical protein Fcan01_26480 [Folsomia candida]
MEFRTLSVSLPRLVVVTPPPPMSAPNLIKHEDESNDAVVRIPGPDLVASGGRRRRQDVEIVSKSANNPVQPRSTTSSAAAAAVNVSNAPANVRTSCAPPPEKLPRFQPETKVLNVDEFVSYFEALISPDGLVGNGKPYKFSSRKEIEVILESMILFVSKNDGNEGLKLFGDDNFDTWKTLSYKSTFFTSLHKSSGARYNLAAKYARYCVISKVCPIFPKFLKCLSFFVYYLYQAKGEDLKKVKGQDFVVGKILENVTAFEEDVFPGQNNLYKLKLDFQKLSISPEIFPLGEGPEGKIFPGNSSQTRSMEVGGVDPILPLVYDFTADLRKTADDYSTSLKKLARNVEECHELQTKLEKKVLESKSEHAKSSALRVDLVRKAHFQGTRDLGNAYQSENVKVVKFLTLCEKEPEIYDEIIDKVNNVLEPPPKRTS